MLSKQKKELYNTYMKSLMLPIVVSNSILIQVVKMEDYKFRNINTDAIQTNDFSKHIEIYNILRRLIELSTITHYYLYSLRKKDKKLMEKLKKDNVDNVNNIKEYKLLYKKLMDLFEEFSKQYKIGEYYDVLKSGYERFNNEFYDQLSKIK